MSSPHQQQQQHGLAAALAASLAAAERPGLFAAREGSLLRLVPPNERLTHEQITAQLEQLLAQQPYAQQLLVLSGPPQRLPRLERHTAAWLRGCCYLGAGNSRQALRDAHAAMAYATAASEKASQLARTPLAAPAPAPAPSTAGNQPVTAAATSLVPTAAEARGAQAAQHSWWPALVLAGQACMAALGDHAQAVVHLAEAAHLAPPDAATVISAALQEAVRGLSADQGYAWATAGLAGLQQQLQDEADMKLPEVLRPRPKWYYYKQWMRQRIHLALLELHLASDHSLQSHSPTQHLPSTNSNNSRAAAAETSTSSTRGRLLLSLLAEGGAEAPAVAEAAAAAGFCQAGTPAALLALPAASASKLVEPAAGVTPAGACRADSGMSGSRVLQLPEAVVNKLLSLDAGDLDLMVQHPVALQGQVYELLEVLQARGPEALQDYTIQPVTWEEVQGLAGGVVGLPLGYTPAAAAAAAVLPLPAPGSSSSSGQEESAFLGSETRPAESDGGAATAGGLQLASVQQGAGWTRAQYVRQALCAQEAVCRGAAAAAAAEGV